MVATRIELPDDRGLIAGFIFRPGEPAVRIGWPEMAQMAERRPRDGLVWLHFNLTDVRACDWLNHGGVLSEAAAGFLLRADSRIRLERLGSGIVGALADLHHDFDLDPESVGVIRFVADAGLL